jgi:RHS repeat-associated protein
MKSTSNVNDTWTNTDNGNFEQWTSSGPGDYSGANMSFAFTDLAGDQYGFGAFDATMGTLTTNSGTTKEDIIWGPASSDGGATQSQLPVTAGAPVVWGVSKFSSPAFNNAQGGGLVSVPWEEDWLFAAGPDKDCEECKRHDAPAKGSEISPRSQILGEEVDLVGTPFFLHYASSRVPGYAGADLFALKDALNLGGWTLSVHHVFEPLLQSYCAGGGCTPYAIVPKAIFFGDGNTRSDADVQSSVPLNGNYLITDEDGTEVYVFNGNGLHLKTLAPMTGAVIYTFAYDANNRLVRVTDANGKVTSIQRDANGHPISITSPYGQKTTLAVDANGYLSTITDPAGHATKLASSAAGLLQSLTDPRGKVYSYTYDGLGMLTKHVDPAGGSITLARTTTATGYSVTNTTALGRNSTDAVTFASSSTQTSQTSMNTWTSGLRATASNEQVNGQVGESITLPDSDSYSGTMGPDPRWGVQDPLMSSGTIKLGTLSMSVQESRAATLGTASDPFSLTSQADTLNINGNTYTSTYTAASGSIVEKSPAGRTTTTVLDAQERISSVQPTGLAKISYTYDSAGRLASASQGTRATTYAYNVKGFLASVTNALGLKRGFTYDSVGNITSTQLEDGRVVRYTHDADGNLTSITPPSGTVHSYGYNAINLATSYTPPVLAGSGATTYTINRDRDLTKVTRPDGQGITYKYDVAGRRISMVAPSATITYTYSSTTGNLAKAAITGGESIAYTYNGSLPASSAWTGAVKGTVRRVYNNNFWITSQTVNTAPSTTFGYDKDGLLTKAGALTIARNAQTGLYISGTLGSTKDTVTYNTFGESTAYTAATGTTTVYSAKYTRDNIGRISAMTETIGGTAASYTYAFDKAGRLTGVKKGGTVVSSYAYDGNSNRLSATTGSGTVHGTYDVQDRILTYGTASYLYNGNGELTTKTVGTKTTSYQYDVFGNLTGVTLADGTAISYLVDAENNRVAKKVNGVVVEGFLYDMGRLVAQLDVNNQIVSQFVYGEEGTPVYMINGGVTYRIIADHVESPRLVVNATTGQIVERVDYDEFGNVTNDTNAGFQPFGYAGGLYDAQTGLIRFGARDYDASTGRWTAKDPLRFGGGDSNLYGYSFDDPVNVSDPTGLDVTETWDSVKETARRRYDRAKELVKQRIDQIKKMFCKKCQEQRQAQEGQEEGREGPEDGVTARELGEHQAEHTVVEATAESVGHATESEVIGPATGTALTAASAAEEGAKGAGYVLHYKQNLNKKMEEIDCGNH